MPLSARRTAVLLSLVLAGCDGAAAARAAVATGGKPARGPAAIRRYGCHSCHQVKGVTGAGGRVGPSLSGAGQRAIIAGSLPNTPENLIRWIMDPRALRPNTAMPDVGVSAEDARDIAAYLYSLR